MSDDIFISAVEDENKEESQPGAPPGTVFVSNEGVAHPGDGTAWIGGIVVNPNDW